MWHVSSRSGVATLRTAIHLLLTYYLKPRPVEHQLQCNRQAPTTWSDTLLGIESAPLSEDEEAETRKQTAILETVANQCHVLCSQVIHRVNCRHRIYDHDTFAILLV